MTEQIVLGGTYTTRHPYGSRLARALRRALTPGPPAAKGIHILRFDPVSGRLNLADTIAGITNPTWLALHPQRNVVYAVSEHSKGRVSALALTAEAAGLRLLNSQPTDGAQPCHVTLDRVGSSLFVANYGSGTVVRFALDQEGRVGEPLQTIRHTGSSVSKRQRSSHPHFVAHSPDNRFAFVPDLGSDRVEAYRIDSGGDLRPNEPASVVVTPGHGPRHLIFHMNSALAFLVSELSSTVTSYTYRAEHGKLDALQTLSALPEDWRGPSTAAGIELHPNGRFLYVSNRGHDSVAVFRIAADGGLARVAITGTRGRTPRGIALDPSGQFLLVAHQSSDDIVTFRVDASDGTLSEVSRTQVPTCVCLTFAHPSKLL